MTLRLSSAGTADAHTIDQAVQLVGGGILDVADHSQTISGPITFLQTATLQSEGTLVASGAIGGAGGIGKTGSGVLKIVTSAVGQNIYAGGTQVSGGTLWLSGTQGSATGSGDVTISHTASLVGQGQISGSLTVHGKLSPGGLYSLNPESLTVGGNLTLASDSLLTVNLTSDGIDQLIVDGDATIAGNLDLVIANGLTLNPGETFTFLSVDGSLLGGFAGVTPGQIIGHADGFNLQVQFNNNGADPSLSLVATTVPEPTTGLLAIMPLIALGLCRTHRATGTYTHLLLPIPLARSRTSQLPIARSRATLPPVLTPARYMITGEFILNCAHNDRRTCGEAARLCHCDVVRPGYASSDSGVAAAAASMAALLSASGATHTFTSAAKSSANLIST